MSETQKRLRGALALFNLGLLGGVASLGWAAFGPSPAFAGPRTFNPIDYAVEPAQPGLDSRAMAVVWAQLDRPEAQPEPAAKALPAPKAPNPGWRLLLANVDQGAPERGSGIVVDALGRQSVLRPGDPVDAHPDYTVIGITVRGAGQAREAIATLSGPEGLVLLTLRREPITD